MSQRSENRAGNNVRAAKLGNAGHVRHKPVVRGRRNQNDSDIGRKRGGDIRRGHGQYAAATADGRATLAREREAVENRTVRVNIDNAVRAAEIHGGLDALRASAAKHARVPRAVILGNARLCVAHEMRGERPVRKLGQIERAEPPLMPRRVQAQYIPRRRGFKFFVQAFHKND